MNATQAENLRILIRHMETNVKRVLDMRYLHNPCGTPACAWGEALTVPELMEALGAGRGGPVLQLYSCFGGTDDEPAHIDRLFGFSINGNEDPTPQEWAAEARKVLAENGYSMDDKPAEFMAKLEALAHEPALSDPAPLWDAPPLNAVFNGHTFYCKTDGVFMQSPDGVWTKLP